MTEGTEGNCEVCGKVARQFCASCKAVFYCSRDCQKKSWKTHKLQCRPLVVKSHPVYGRYAVATREIKAGEIVLKEFPLVLGPKQHTIPLCLGCHAKLLEDKVFCKVCDFPLCSAICQNSNYHKTECSVLAKMSTVVSFFDMTKPHPAYQCITPLRCLLLKNSDPKKWETLLDLQSHEEQIKGTELYTVNDRNIVDFIRVCLGYKEADAELIHRICGILYTNSFELLHNGQKIRGLYPLSAMLAHSCTPNTKHVFDSDNCAIFRATQTISKGQPLYTTYSHILWDTLSRRNHLQISKFFLCDCKRCEDPTELGANLSTLYCSRCKGEMRSTEPLNNAAEWKCCHCEHTLLGKQIKIGNDLLEKELKSRGRENPELLESFIDHYKHVLHPNHRFMTEIKYSLIRFFGNSTNCRYRDMTQKQLENKVHWCRELLSIADIIDPCKSLLRGNILFELQAGLVALAKFLLSNDLITQEKAEESMTEAVGLLQEASEILKQEPEYNNGKLDERLNWLSSELEL